MKMFLLEAVLSNGFRIQDYVADNNNINAGRKFIKKLSEENKKILQHLYVLDEEELGNNSEEERDNEQKTMFELVNEIKNLSMAINR